MLTYEEKAFPDDYLVNDDKELLFFTLTVRGTSRKRRTERLKSVGTGSDRLGLNFGHLV